MVGGGRRLFTYEVRESLASDSASGGGGGSSSCQVFYRAWDDDPPTRFPLRNRTCFETSSFYGGPVVRRVTPSVWNR